MSLDVVTVIIVESREGETEVLDVVGVVVFGGDLLACVFVQFSYRRGSKLSVSA